MIGRSLSVLLSTPSSLSLGASLVCEHRVPRDLLPLPLQFPNKQQTCDKEVLERQRQDLTEPSFPGCVVSTLASGVGPLRSWTGGGEEWAWEHFWQSRN